MADDPDWAPKQDMSLLCRVCANQHDYLIPIFEGEGLDHDMPTKMEKHLPVKVRENDKLPTQMCYQCASTIIAWSDLVTNCLEADKKLTRMLRINEKKSAMAAGTTLADDSDHYEDAYDAGGGGGGGDDEDEDFEKEIKQLISDAGVELSSSGTSKQLKLAKPAAKPAARVSSRKRKSEATTPVKRESKKSKSEGAAAATASSSSSGTLALLKPKEENVSGDDRFQVWTCCVCSAKLSSSETFRFHVSGHHMTETEDEHHDDNTCSQCFIWIGSHCSDEPGPLYTCHFCDQIFLRKFVLENHLKIEHGRVIYQNPNLKWYACTLCGTALYMKASRIIKHLWNKHQVTDSEINIEDLIVKTMQDITFPCTYCEELCVLSRCCPRHSRRKLLRVKEQKCSDHPWAHECHKCELTLTDCSEFWEHTIEVHSDSDIVKCNLCTLRTKYLFMLEDHIRDKHGKRLSVLARHSASFIQKLQFTEDGVTAYMCLECNATGAKIAWLKTHLLTHTREKTCACDVCGKRFKLRSNLVHHKRSHIEPRPHECTVCGKAFGSRGNLYYHMRIHTDERSYVCELCGKSFVQWASLFYHKFSHGEERKFVCSYCGQTYKSPNHLRSHVNIHTKKNKYVCETCGKEFFKRESLRTHRIVHATARPFACEFCPADFKQRKHLKQHYKTHAKP